jgi:hypothetical protein
MLLTDFRRIWHFNRYILLFTILVCLVYKIICLFLSSRVIDLETALLEDCTAASIYSICKGKSVPDFLRAEVWQICLQVQEKGNQLVLFNEIFDLPEQTILREDCQQFVGRCFTERFYLLGHNTM